MKTIMRSGLTGSSSTTKNRRRISQNPVPHKASSAQLFLRPEFCVEAVVLTVSTRELRTDRRRAVAVGGGQPPTRQRRHSLRWLARSVVSGGIGRQVADSRGRPDAPRAVHATRRIILTNSLYGHHQRRRPPRRASPHTRSEGTARRSVRRLTTTYSSRTVGSRVVVVAIACSNKR